MTCGVEHVDEEPCDASLYLVVHLKDIDDDVVNRLQDEPLLIHGVWRQRGEEVPRKAKQTWVVDGSRRNMGTVKPN
jgi:hypothetical protein